MVYSLRNVFNWYDPHITLAFICSYFSHTIKWKAGGVLALVGPLTLKFDRATWPFLKKLTCDMKPIDMGKNISDMTWAIS